MKTNIKHISIKTVFFIVLVIVWNSIVLHINPLIQNSLAINQMNNDVSSNLFIQIYTYLSNYSFIIFILVAMLLFYKDALKIINYFKENKTNEE